MAEEKSVLEILIEAGRLSRPMNRSTSCSCPQTELNATFTHPPADDLEAFYRASAHDPFWATLGHAIQAYARLEMWLCQVFKEVTGMTAECAGINFYKITSSSARDDILEKLAKRKYGDT